MRTPYMSVKFHNISVLFVIPSPHILTSYLFQNVSTGQTFDETHRIYNATNVP